MKSIELTEEQKNKLLEMCNTLWKQENWIFLLDVPNDLNKNHCFIMGFIGNNDYIPNCDCYIHWFEFCMTHLVEKIFNPKDLNNQKIKQKFISFFMEMSSYSWFIQDSGIRESFANHPVDYLYQEFKKLK